MNVPTIFPQISILSSELLRFVISLKKKKKLGNSLEVQRLGLGTSIAKSVCSISGWGTKIPKATQQGQTFSLKNLYQGEVSQKEKHQYSILTHIYGI